MSMYHVEDKLRKRTWADKLIEKSLMNQAKRFNPDLKENRGLDFLMLNDLTSAVLEKNKEINNNCPMSDLNYSNHLMDEQARAFREQVETAKRWQKEKVRK